MRKKEDKKEKNVKKESELVTKESLCAVFALFSALALLVLFTNEWIFGSIGGSIHAFLTGVFGYCAYPVFFAGLYLSITALFGKRFIKNRKATAFIVLATICVALLIHTALTYSWDMDGYLTACFRASENLNHATVCGWLGALPVFALVSVTTRIGAIIIFALLAVFFVYLTVILLKKGVKKSENKEEKELPSSITPVEIPVSTLSVPQPQPQGAVAIETEPQVYGNGEKYEYANVATPQSPAFSLSDEGEQNSAGASSQATGFSPFGFTQQSTHSEPVATDRDAYERSREFLFGVKPEEIYRKNLIFDPNSRANNRPPVVVKEGNYAQSGYIPSYVDEYQTSVNAGERPTKIFTDKVQPSQSETIAPLQPIQQPVVEQPTITYPTYEERVEINEAPINSVAIEKEEYEGLRSEESSANRRHEYMDLFSTENPNVYGEDGIGKRMAENVFNEERTTNAFDREDAPLRGEELYSRNEESRLEEEEPRGRGIDIFDEVEDPYTLRSDFDEEEVRGSEREVFSAEPNRFSDRFAEEEQDKTEREVTPSVVSKPTPPPPPPKPRVVRPYVRVPLDDFDCRDVEPSQNPQEVEETKLNIIATLEDFKVTGAAIASVTHGPTVTRYNVTIPRSISPKKVVALDDPIAISLHSSGVNIYPNYEDGVVSIEVPNKNRQFVQLGCMLSGDTFVNAKPSSLMFTMGKDVGNRKVYGDISKMIHMLVAGSSGSGKSVFLGSLIISLIYKYSPEELRLILIDPKKTEFVLYNDLPHLMINEIITDAHKAVQSLNWAIGEMNRRYGLFEQMSRAGTYVVNLDQYNQNVEKTERLP
ncbi:MAG: hypothetical protein E7381_04390, partial [Clostridiales bacterium]|nr:hypothetical protein [Clostridiales bacterium]